MYSVAFPVESPGAVSCIMWVTDSGENLEVYLEYSCSFPLAGPLVVMSMMSVLGWHSSRSLMPGIGKGQACPVHLLILQTMACVAWPLYGMYR